MQELSLRYPRGVYKMDIIRIWYKVNDEWQVVATMLAGNTSVEDFAFDAERCRIEFLAVTNRA